MERLSIPVVSCLEAFLGRLPNYNYDMVIISW